MKYKEAKYKLGVLISVQKIHWDNHEDDVDNFQNVARCPNCRILMSDYHNLFTSISGLTNLMLMAIAPLSATLMHSMVLGHYKAKRLYPEHYAPEREPEGHENV